MPLAADRAANVYVTSYFAAHQSVHSCLPIVLKVGDASTTDGAAWIAVSGNGSRRLGRAREVA